MTKYLTLPAGLVELTHLTQARIAQGRFGPSAPTIHEQRFQLDHARARAAVWPQVDEVTLVAQLAPLGLPILPVESEAEDRADYVRRPDRGRRLSAQSRPTLEGHGGPFDIAIVISDGLSGVTTRKW